MPDRISFHSLAVEVPGRLAPRDFADPALPAGFTLQLQQADGGTDYLASDVSAELIRRYITGDPITGMPPTPFMVNGEPREIHPRMCDHVGLVIALQPDPWDLPFPRYEPEELLQMIFKCPRLWRQVRGWALELSAGRELALPNDSTGRAADSCDPLSTGELSTPELSGTRS